MGAGDKIVGGYNVLVSVVWILIGAGACVAAASGYGVGGWLGLFGVGYGVWGLYRTAVGR